MQIICRPCLFYLTANSSHLEREPMMLNAPTSLEAFSVISSRVCHENIQMCTTEAMYVVCSCQKGWQWIAGQASTGAGQRAGGHMGTGR